MKPSIRNAANLFKSMARHASRLALTVAAVTALTAGELRAAPPETEQSILEQFNPLNWLRPQQDPAGSVVNPAIGADEYDLRPQADAIMRTIERRMARATPNRPLVVLIGQTHTHTAHLLLEQVLVDRFETSARRNGKNFAYGYEWDHSTLTRLVSNISGGSYPIYMQGWLEQDDPDGQRAGRIFAAMRRSVDAPAAFTNHMMFMMNRGISVRFMDASTNGGRLDADDHLTARFIEASGAPRTAAIADAEPRGIAIRNRVMVENSLLHIREKGASVYFLSVGASHVAGNENYDYKFAQSLYAGFAATGADVLPLMLVSDDYQSQLRHSPEAARVIAQGIVVNGLSNRKFTGATANMRNELAYIRKTCEASGAPKFCFNRNAGNYPYSAEVARDYPAWIDQARAARERAATRSSHRP